MILIAGPCVIQNMDILKSTAESLLEVIQGKDIDFYFKSSCIKDNRTKKESYRGVGFKTGIPMLQKVAEEYNIKICTDFHTVEQIQTYSPAVDVIQIPAFLARQASLLEAADCSGKIVHVKKPQFMDPADINYLENYLSRSGQIFLTDRGTCFGYKNWMMDPRHVRIMRKKTSKSKILADITHPNRLTENHESELMAYDLGVAYLSAGADGIFLETHPAPGDALCDTHNQIKTKSLGCFIENFYMTYKSRRVL
ncbi:MAG: hypothetical protein JXB88_20180 [Spirochaetales bacterium]|nr:hypothetical protein [Spirochaetales bacterium]